MADSVSVKQSMSMNPWVLYLQKLGLELKCPLCLNLFNRPMLLPCDHIFCQRKLRSSYLGPCSQVTRRDLDTCNWWLKMHTCRSCVPRTAPMNGLSCPVCRAKCAPKDLRPVSFMENMAVIFRSLDAAFIANLLLSPSTDSGGVIGNSSTSSIVGLDHKLSRESSGQSVFSLTAATTKLAPVHYPVGEGISGCDSQKNTDEAFQLDMNQAEQLFPSSPPLFGDVKGSDNDSDLSPENCPSDKQGKSNYDDGSRIEKRDSPDSGIEGDLKDSKRQKKLNYDPLETCVKSDDHLPLRTPSQTFAVSCPELNPKSEVSPSVAQLPLILEDSLANKTTCAFCQTSKISEASGPMMHYANGNPVEGDKAACPDVIHVHAACIEWAPQVYFVGETVKNLKAELARGSKLKCTRCGLKGAATGCYMKSCKRSYHFTCAQEVSKCRWDHENFLLLCPAHSSVKFPNEKSRKSSKNHAKHPERTSQDSRLSFASTDETRKIVLCGSALSPEEKHLLVKFACMIGGTVCKLWSPNVTHVIAATDANGACTRTLKVLMATSNGRWVLKTDWIEACVKDMRLVGEEPYEVHLDNHGYCEGPKNGRIRAMQNAPKLFDGLKFYFSGEFVSGYKEDLQSLVIAAGGVVSKSKEELVAHACDEVAGSSKTIVVYNLDPPHGSKLGEELTTIWNRLSDAEDLATKIGGQIIGHTWVLESITGYKLQPFVS